MLINIPITPSLNSLFVTGFLLLLILFILVTNLKQFNNLDFYRKIMVLSLLTIAIASHGLIHLGLETVYGFNPYNWV
jgi:hypothetical protein